MNGLHLIADLYKCHCDASLLTDRRRLERLCHAHCVESALRPLGTYFYQFRHEDGAPAGVTGTVVLAESHLAIHTWPEECNVTLDLYVCNYSRDNSGRARAVFRSLIDILAPGDMVCHELHRGRPESQRHEHRIPVGRQGDQRGA